ncbi:MAG: transposase [Escherichia coli]|nr:transposase [Escherichia coli]
MFKLLIYGYFNSIRSSRKLARECIFNIEVLWHLSKVPPDFRTVSDFRKDNLKLIKKVFKSLNK